MIVVDENIHTRRLMAAIQQWYRGRVVSVTTLRPGTVIKDDAIPALLMQQNQPTFITINAVDFWQKTPPHQAYSIIAIPLPKEKIRLIPNLLRACLNLPGFSTKQNRMGKIYSSNRTTS